MSANSTESSRPNPEDRDGRLARQPDPVEGPATRQPSTRRFARPQRLGIAGIDGDLAAFSLTPGPTRLRAGETLRLDVTSRTDLLKSDVSHGYVQFDLPAPPYFSRNTLHYGPADIPGAPPGWRMISPPA
jgi:hypothetical protein